RPEILQLGIDAGEYKSCHRRLVACIVRAVNGVVEELSGQLELGSGQARECLGEVDSAGGPAAPGHAGRIPTRPLRHELLQRAVSQVYHRVIRAQILLLAPCPPCPRSFSTWVGR